MAKGKKKASGKAGSLKEQKAGRKNNKKKDKTKKKKKGEKKAVKAASNPVPDSTRVVAETAATEPQHLDTPTTIEEPSNEPLPAAADTFEQPSGYSLLSGFWFRAGVMVIVILAGIAIYSNSVDPPETEIAGAEFSQQTAPASTGQSENTAVDAITVTALPATTDRQDSEEQTPAGESESIETDNTIAMPDSELSPQVLTDQSQQYRPLEPEEPRTEPEQPESAPAATGHAAPPRYPAGGYPYRSGRYAYPPAPYYYPGYQR